MPTDYREVWEREREGERKEGLILNN